MSTGPTPYEQFNLKIPDTFPENVMNPRAAKALVQSECWTDANPMLNLSSFVTTFLEPEGREIFADGSFLAKVYRSNWYRENDCGGILVRVIQYTLDDPQRTGNQERHVLLTNLFDAAEYPAQEVICEYHERWEIENVFDEQKTHQDPSRAEKTTNFRSETSDGLTQEIYAVSLAHFVTRALMFQAAKEANIDVDRLSFKGCFQILKTRLPEHRPEDGMSRLQQWFEALIWEMGSEKIPPRRNRINPRVIKRKMSRWNKARPQHRNLPPLKKKFYETIVMLH